MHACVSEGPESVHGSHNVHHESADTQRYTIGLVARNPVSQAAAEYVAPSERGRNTYSMLHDAATRGHRLLSS